MWEGLGAEPPDAGSKRVWGQSPPAFGDFYNFLMKIAHFRHVIGLNFCLTLFS